MIGQILIVIACVLMMFVGFGLGHWSGYYKGRTDQLEEIIKEREVK